MDNATIIKVEQGSYFSMPVIVIGSMLIFGALSVFLVWLYHALIFDSPFMKTSDILLGFLAHELPLMVLLGIAGSILVFSSKTFEFDCETKSTCIRGHFLKWSWGEWHPFQPDCSHFAFQRYEQTSSYSFGGFFKKEVPEHIYDLRMIKNNKSFESLISASDFRAVASIILLGKKLSETYEIPFYDYVKEIVKKQMNSHIGLL